MKDFLKEDSKYKIVAKLSIISVTSLLMMFAGTASFGSYYHSVFAAAKNPTHTTSSSSTFLRVITKVDNIKGVTKKPSDFTITVSGKSPSPKSFSGNYYN